MSGEETVGRDVDLDARPAEDAPVDDVGENVTAPNGAAGGVDEAVTVEDLLTQLESVTAERDEYLRLAQSKQAEFENFRRRTAAQLVDDVARAQGRLVEELLPVLDALDAGLAHGDETAGAVRTQLLGVLEREGLERLDPGDGDPFDPNVHEAVAHEPGDGGEPVVAETFRAGYRWRGHLLRAAMVRARD